MQSVWYFGLDVQAYCQGYPHLDLPVPAVCPHCAKPCRWHRHGSYQRRVCAAGHDCLIPIQRWRCPLCRRTVSLLPSFCLPFRHYLAELIEAVLELRLEGSRSWGQLEKAICRGGQPGRSTLRGWVGCFLRGSGDYLRQLLQQLATWQLGAGKLELLLADLAAKSDTGGCLPGAARHLWAWLVELGRAGRGQGWLSVLCQWGGWRGLRRLL